METDVEVSTDERKGNEDKLKVETEENKTIKQSPVPKPPRLGTLNSARLDPQAYINFEIEPTESKSSKPDKTPDVKQDIPQNTSTETKVQNTEPKTELKTSTQVNANKNTNQLKTRSTENAIEDENTNQLERRTTSTLPKLPPTDKRKAPEPPGVAKNTKQMSVRGSKKGECDFLVRVDWVSEANSLSRLHLSAVEFNFE